MNTSTPSGRPTKVVDPVCKMKLEPERAAGSIDHRGTTYRFCSTSCLKKFESDPESYLVAQP